VFSSIISVDKIVHGGSFNALLRFTDYDYPFGIFKLFFLMKKIFSAATYYSSILGWNESKRMVS
jgi:hypothetical protein